MMFAIWLLFDEKDEKYLLNIIKKLGSKYNSPIFNPHITVYGLIDLSLPKLENYVKKSITGMRSFYVNVESISHSDYFWKTLFLDIRLSSELLKIHEKLEKNLLTESRYDFLPHISLCYKDIDEKLRNNIAKSIIIKKRFQVSKIGIHQHSEDIEKWKLVRTFNLIH